MMDLRYGKMTTLPMLLKKRSGHASVFFENKVYVAGGQTTVKKKKIITDSVEK